MIPISVLDLSPITTATPGAAALRNSLDLARLADALGYARRFVGVRQARDQDDELVAAEAGNQVFLAHAAAQAAGHAPPER